MILHTSSHDAARGLGIRRTIRSKSGIVAEVKSSKSRWLTTRKDLIGVRINDAIMLYCRMLDADDFDPDAFDPDAGFASKDKDDKRWEGEDEGIEVKKKQKKK